MSKQVKWGIIGTGNIAGSFAESFETEYGILQAVGSRTIEKAEAFAKKHDIPKALTNAELIDSPNVDIVYIATPHHLHFETIMAALEAGKHVVAEKPITVRADQLKEARVLADKKELYLLEAMTIHYMPLYHELGEWLESLDLGPLKYIQVNFGSFKPEPHEADTYFFDKSLAGGALFDIGVYALNFARWFMSCKPTEIESFGQMHETGVDETSVTILRNDAGEMASVNLTFRAKQPKAGMVVFENGYLVIDDYPAATRAVVTGPNGEQAELEIGDGSKRLTYESHAISKMIVEGAENHFIDLTTDVIEIMDEIRRQWGLTYDFDEK